jgi:hypothetical protein
MGPPDVPGQPTSPLSRGPGGEGWGEGERFNHLLRVQGLIAGLWAGNSFSAPTQHLGHCPGLNFDSHVFGLMV